MSEIVAYSEQFKASDGTYNAIDGYEEGWDLEDFYIIGVLNYGATTGGEVFAVFKAFMEYMESREDNWCWPFPDVHEGVAYIVLSKLSEIGAIEYGTSIRGSWLTEMGLQMLVDFKKLSE